MRDDQDSTRKHIAWLLDQLDSAKSASAAKRISTEIRTAVTRLVEAQPRKG